MYFRNKFNKEFLYLCNNQEPKGGTVTLDDKDHIFWEFRRNGTKYQPKTVHVIPLLLYNTIESSNPNDENIENFMMICEDKSTTEIKCYYDKNAVGGPDKVFVCDTIPNLTGDLTGKDNDE